MKKKLTKNQSEILDWLGHEQVRIEATLDGKYYLTKFGLRVKTIKQVTFDAIEPYLSGTCHAFKDKTTYKLAL